MKIVASLLFLLPSVAFARELAAETKRLGAPSNQRDLQDLGLLCGALFDEILADSPITCSCLPVLFPKLSVSAACSTVDPLCIGGELKAEQFCTSPEVTGSIDISALLAGAPDAIKLDLCFTELTIFGYPIELLGLPLCFSSAIELLDGSFTGDSAPCSATIGGAACSTCSFCEEGGMVFDCSNIDPEIVSSTCTSAFPTEFADVTQPDHFGVPVLDGLRR